MLELMQDHQFIFRFGIFNSFESSLPLVYSITYDIAKSTVQFYDIRHEIFLKRNENDDIPLIKKSFVSRENVFFTFKYEITPKEIPILDMAKLGQIQTECSFCRDERHPT